ncbi:MAG: YgiT-type zinc finger protein [Gammaproteobacteria bacterium]|jgi:YgiT-type zinc finger domain-containing protein|nr:YgiT-type zinc finger protein [Gammaproteobacteria bacterium]
MASVLIRNLRDALHRQLKPPPAPNCLHCATKCLDAALVRYRHRLGGHALIVEDVPCLRCPECGEEYLRHRDAEDDRVRAHCRP